jgi:hypothetical protein
MITTAPLFQTLTSNVSSATQGDTLVVSGTTYYVMRAEPDGTGYTTLILSKQAISNG